jgi:hypothetical protein
MPIFKDPDGVTAVDPKMFGDKSANTGRIAISSPEPQTQKEAEAG